MHHGLSIELGRDKSMSAIRRKTEDAKKIQKDLQSCTTLTDLFRVLCSGYYKSFWEVRSDSGLWIPEEDEVFRIVYLDNSTSDFQIPYKLQKQLKKLYDLICSNSALHYLKNIEDCFVLDCYKDDRGKAIKIKRVVVYSKSDFGG